MDGVEQCGINTQNLEVRKRVHEAFADGSNPIREEFTLPRLSSHRIHNITQLEFLRNASAWSVF